MNERGVCTNPSNPRWRRPCRQLHLFQLPGFDTNGLELVLDWTMQFVNFHDPFPYVMAIVALSLHFVQLIET